MKRKPSLRVRLAVSHLVVVVAGAFSVFVVAVVIAPRLLRSHIGPMGPLMPEMTEAMTDELQRQLEAAVAQVLIVAVAVSVTVALTAAYLASRRLLSPLDDVRRVVRRLAAGAYHERLEPPGEEELAVLAHDINHLASALDDTDRNRMRLLNDVSHELRTPLTTIEGYMEAILDEVIEPSPEIFATVAEEARRLKRLASDVSLLSRAEEGALELHRRKVDIGVLAGEVTNRLAPQFEDAEVSAHVASGDVAIVDGDRDRLIQVLTNLIGNAITHTPPGGSVLVSWATNREYVVVDISDTGRGIAVDDVSRIFERFYRVDASAPGGTGVGLTIARSIARLHGGDLTVASPGIGQGSVFTLTLPAS